MIAKFWNFISAPDDFMNWIIIAKKNESNPLYSNH